MIIKIHTIIFCLSLIFISISCLHVESIISNSQPYAILDLDVLSEQDKQILQSLYVKFRCSYYSCGHLEKLQQKVMEFLKSIGNSQQKSEAGASIINKIITQLLKILNAETARIALEAYTIIDTFDMPRWHLDGSYFEGQYYKIVCTLKGPGTLFCNVSDETRIKFQEIQAQGLSPHVHVTTRAQLVELLKNYSVYQALAAQIVIFLVGDPQSAAIHSEPAIVQERLFLSIVPTTYEQIKKCR